MSLFNANLTSWKSRTGSDGNGEPTFGAEHIGAAKIRCLVTAPNSRQAQIAERESFAVDAMVTLRILSGPAKGDVIECDHASVSGKTLIVRKASLATKPGLRGLHLFCEEWR